MFSSVLVCLNAGFDLHCFTSECSSDVLGVSIRWADKYKKNVYCVFCDSGSCS